MLWLATQNANTRSPTGRSLDMVRSLIYELIRSMIGVGVGTKERAAETFSRLSLLI